MKSQFSLQDNRPAMSETLRSMNPHLCFALGLVISAIIAYYVPLILIALTGIWVNNLTMMIQLAVGIVILVSQNLVGNRLNNIFLAGAAVALAFSGYEAYDLAHTSQWSNWPHWWMLFFFPIAACLLNAWLFLRFKVMAELG